MTNTIETKTPFLKKITPFDKEGQPGKIIFAWGDGIKTELHIDDVSEQNKIRAQYHGLSQRLGDSVAGCSKDHAYGYARETLDGIMAILKTPDWTKPAAGGGGKIETSLSVDDLIAAIAKIKKQPVEKIDPVVRAATREQRDTWRKNSEVNAVLLDIAAKRAKETAKETPADFDFPLE